MTRLPASPTRSLLRRLSALWLGAHLLWVGTANADWIGELTEAFANSDIRFQRSGSNVPFFPAAFADTTHYTDIELKADGKVIGSFDQTSVSLGGGIPYLLGSRDAVGAGLWLDWSHFDSKTSAFDSFEAYSVGLPFGWFRQVDEDTQVAAFAMPLAHETSLPSSSVSWEVMGGAGVREEVSESFWWAYGVFVEAGPGEDYLLPYLGASWELSRKLTLSAVLPWPAVLYAPTPDTLFQFGASPSGASWSLSSGRDEVFYELGHWDLGIAAETRLTGNLWLAFKGGVAGLRSLRLSGDRVEAPEFDLNTGPYVGVSLNFRPSL